MTSAARPPASLCELAAERYRKCRTFDREFVRAKLTRDPMYLDLLRSGALPARGRLVDLGCGRGILLALVGSTRTLADRGEWPADWPAPPAGLELVGVERHPRRVATARLALGQSARVYEGDVRAFDLPPSSAIVLLDVLHYLSAADQERVIARAADALAPGGVLVLREASADEGARFALTRAAERACAILRGHWRQHFHYRSTRRWVELLEQRGLHCSTDPSRAGTPYANVLVRGHRPS